ncbi:MAG TPA: TrbI/VirB10 family protein, partial [Sphingomicrobium sp.]
MNMRLNQRLNERLVPANDHDPRETGSAEVIDLATRNVLPAVTQRKPRSEGFGLAAGVAVVALLGAVTMWTMNDARQPKPDTAVLPDEADVAAIQSFESAPNVPPQAITPIRDIPHVPVQQPVTVPGSPPSPSAAPGWNPHASPTVVFDASALPPSPSASLAAGSSGPAMGGNPNDDFASRLGGVGGSAATAVAMVDPKTTVTQGTLIPAILETAINTDVPGYVRAIVSADVRSFDGSRVLVPRSSRLIGQYKSGLQAGQKRAYVVWTRLIRPDGVSVNIGSPAVGFSGETGLAGKVNNHFFERFGSAILLSVIGGLTSMGGGAATVITGGG